MGEARSAEKVKHDSLAGVRRLIVGLIGLAIGRGPHVEEAVRVDCDKRVRVVHRHVVCEQMDCAVHHDCFTQSFFCGHVVTKTDPVLNWNQGLTLSTARS